MRAPPSFPVRKAAFDAVGGFNASYSLPGQLGVGFDHELVGRLWGRRERVPLRIVAV